MKKLAIASVASLALTAGSALAADLGAPYYKAPPPPPALTWTGCYINGGVGYGMWDQQHYLFDTATGVPLAETTNSAGEGWLGRLGAGCDYQVSSNFVLGVLGDYDFMDIHGTFDDPSAFGIAGEEKETGAWAVGARVGYLVTPALLTFVDGGYTQARFDQVNLGSAYPPPPIGTPSGLVMPAQTYNGWFIGGGTEYALSSIVPFSGLFWRTEYRFASYQSANNPYVCVSAGFICGAPTSTVFAQHLQNDVQTVTSGVVWRFNWPGH